MLVLNFSCLGSAISNSGNSWSNRADFLHNRMVLVGILIGLINALKLIQPIKDKYPGITYADLFQLASATAIEVSDFFSLL